MFRVTATKDSESVIKAQKQTLKPVVPPTLNLFEEFTPIKKNEAVLSPIQLGSVSKL